LYHYHDSVLTPNVSGVLVPAINASVTVYNAGTLVLATIYRDDGIHISSNPVITDTNGRFGFYAADGRYDLTISGVNVVTFTISDVEVADLTEAAAADRSWITDQVQFINSAAPGTPPAGSVALYTKVSDKSLYYKKDDGTEVGPLSVGGGGSIIPLNNVFTGTNQFNNDVITKGPNPWADIRAFGARAIDPALAPSIPGITVGINSGSPTATLSAASTFVNGDGVVIFGAGAATGMATPGAPTVAPDLAANLTGTGLVVAAPAGGTTFNYQVIAVNKTGGYTAASAVGSTATGSTLGAKSVAISTLARSGTTVTVTTSAPHGLAAGAYVYISGTSDAANWEGVFLVAASADNTHFTYVMGMDSAAGAPTAATGGAAKWFNCNHVTWSSVAGAWYYIIYGRTGGSLTPLGFSWPGLLYWDDFGSPMMDNWLPPYYIPATPPGAASANYLSTTISSGAGTTTLTLANNAGTTVAGATILFDNGPALVAAAGAGTAFVPFGNFAFVINSHVVLPATPAVTLAGNLFVNDTVEFPAGAQINGLYQNPRPSGGGPPAFSFRGYPEVRAGRAPVALYGSTNNSSDIHGLNILPARGSGVGLMSDGGQQTTVDGANFVTNDYMDIGYVMFSTGPDSFFNVVNNATFLANQFALGSTSTPMFYAHTGKLTMRELSFSARGIFHWPNDAGAYFTLEHVRNQGGIAPMITLYSTSGGVGGTLDISDVELDTMAMPMVTNLIPAGFAGTVYFKGGNIPSSLVPLVSGKAMNLIGVSPGGQTGQNFNIASYAGQFTSNAVQVTGTGVMGYAMPPPAAPSVVLSAGGGVPVGTWLYQIAALDANGNESTLGLNSASVVVTGGNQTVTITPPAAPFGSPSYKAYRHNPGGGSGQVNVGATAWTSNMVDTFGFTAGSPPVPLATSSGFGSSGIETPVLLFAPTTFANLGTPGNGRFVYCSDCTIANPCAGAGTGALAKRLNAVWVCN
jgi:hypothetical protein